MVTGWMLVLVAVNLGLVAMVRWFLNDRDRPASACSPNDVLAALAWEGHGKVEGGRFEGRHRDRNVTIQVRGGHYEIAIEGEPSAGTLTGDEALAAIREAARTVEGLA